MNPTLRKTLLAALAGLAAAVVAITQLVTNAPDTGGGSGAGGAIASAGKGGGAAGKSGAGGAGKGGVGGSVLFDAGVPPVPSKGMTVGANGWFLGPDWGFGSPWQGRPSFAVGSNPWSPTFLADLTPFSTYRFLEYVGTNSSKVTAWSQRRSQTDAGNYAPYVDAGTSAVTPGLAYEWVFDLCNRSNKTCWVTLPVLADDNYITQFVSLAKRQLNTRLIVEISNEVSGGWFPQTAQATAAAATVGINCGDQWRNAECYVISRSVFAAKQIRLQGVNGEVVACGVASADILKSALASQYAKSGEKFGAVCMSAYYGNGRNGATYTLAQAKSDIDALETGADGMTTYENIGKTYGLPVYAYEGGLHVLSSAATFAVKAEAGQADAYLLDAALRHLKLINYYTDASTWPTAQGQGAWGLRKQIGTPTARSNAVVNWIATH